MKECCYELNSHRKRTGKNIKGEFELIRVGGEHFRYLVEFEGKTVTAKEVSDHIKRKLGKPPHTRGMTLFGGGMLRLATKSDFAGLPGELLQEFVRQQSGEESSESGTHGHDVSAGHSHHASREDADALDDISAHASELPVDATERDAIVKSRIGQGQFRKDLIKLWRGCAVTGVTDPTLLRASHAKPWRDSSNAERLDPHNGLLLIPNLDHLFDRHLIGFENDGRIRVSSGLDDSDRKALGVNPEMRLRKVIPETQEYLSDHLQSLR